MFSSQFFWFPSTFPFGSLINFVLIIGFLPLSVAQNMRICLQDDTKLD